MTSPIHILLIDDDEDDIALFEIALRDHSFPIRLSTLTDGDEVIDYLAETPTQPDLIFLDLNMPRMHGRDVLLALKHTLTAPSRRIFVLSTSSSPEDAAFCLANGAEQFLTKPASHTLLREMLAQILDKVSN
ncbi:response regulator [Fibrella aestuarina]|uniref:response regulator n=1 Tax=Fibrella aestuarina TaxID=651143 RepID=UPI00059E951C|nr:response regulator [Fibrella aestuarina]